MKHILGLVILISMDNGMQMKPLEQIKFPSDCGVDWEKLDKEAATLNLEQAEIFCCGEESEMNALLKETGFTDLNKTLNDIFDGYLGEYFWASISSPEGQA
ncbi:hypothetical protein OAE19_05195 [Porticoccaceae bacterium]|nr:hypothetical protein [Porticoccaceae bacterium]